MMTVVRKSFNTEGHALKNLHADKLSTTVYFELQRLRHGEDVLNLGQRSA
jgi:hypothetical protein